MAHNTSVTQQISDAKLHKRRTAIQPKLSDLPFAMQKNSSGFKKMAAGAVSVISSFYQGSPSACHKPDLAYTLKLNALCVDVQQYREKS